MKELWKRCFECAGLQGTLVFEVTNHEEITKQKVGCADTADTTRSSSCRNLEKDSASLIAMKIVVTQSIFKMHKTKEKKLHDFTVKFWKHIWSLSLFLKKDNLLIGKFNN